MPRNAAADFIASDQWCSASAPSAVLPSCSPAPPSRRDSHSFNPTTPASTSSVHHAGPGCGVTIWRAACQATTPAMRKTKAATVSPANASALPCP